MKLQLIVMRYSAILMILLLVIAGCNNETKIKDPLFELMSGTGIDFNNTVIDDSLENSFLFRNFYNGGGVSIGDINNDGFADVFLTSNTGANKLYLNKGDFHFEDISDKAGIIHDDKWNTGVTFADVNADGWLDIYVCSSGHMGTGKRKNKLYINNHDLTFTEDAEKFGLSVSAYTTQVSFFDYDLDGDLDCFMINNSPIPINQLNFANRRDLPDSLWKIADFLKGGGDHLYRNDGLPVSTPSGERKGGFTEVTTEAGIHGGLISFGLGVSVGDINNDGWPDVFVSNDSYERDYMYINQKNGTFKDELEDWVQHTSFSSMGTDIADINNDGYPDLFTTDMLPGDDYRLKTTGSFDNISLFNNKKDAGFYYQYTKNCLQLNNGNGKFLDIGRYSGVAGTDWSWGALMFDMDNDGWNDLLVCNGVNRDVTNLDFMTFFANDIIKKMILTKKKDEIDKVLKEIPQTPLPNKIYRNDKNLKFSDIGKEWGLGQPTFSNGAAYGDLDNDGDLDLIINNENQPAFVYKNKSVEKNKTNYIGISLKDTGNNKFAIGSKVQVFAGKQILTRELIPSRGFQSSVDYKIIIGLGNIVSLDSMNVIWPDRKISHYSSPVINMVHIIDRSKTETETILQQAASWQNKFFTPVSSGFEKHKEDTYVDFYNEPGIPRVLSREGPALAAADVNGDGLTDVFIGGATGTASQLYLQNANGQFEEKHQKDFDMYADFEDVSAVFLDYDKDGDMDLLVCPGGNVAIAGSRELQLRLYQNDGKGNFTINTSAFPPAGMNISVVAVNDYNKDGYPDLFIGGRNYPQEYGANPKSFLFLNDKTGHFKDVTSSVIPLVENVGMITGAAWENVIGDETKELIITGEWMAPHIYTYNNDHFEEIKTNLNDLYGWWQTITTCDVNGDGRKDLLLGNIGENFYLQPDKNHPAKLWLNDFDGNGTIDKIITYTINGKDMPVFLKNDLQEQLPGIKKESLKNEAYANKSIQDLFTREVIKKSTVKIFNYASSCAAINKGDGNFEVQKLPVMSQLSSINCMLSMDVNNDGLTDIVTGGNQFGFLPQFEKLDASFGDILLNNGKGGFIWQAPGTTGFSIRGEIRGIGLIKNKNVSFLLFVQNNDYPILYKQQLSKNN